MEIPRKYLPTYPLVGSRFIRGTRICSYVYCVKELISSAILCFLEEKKASIFYHIISIIKTGLIVYSA
jgi:hypothetical protein